ncbi:MAG: hypothetical protein QOJ39_2832 [Candidatus Eremiobacteraeota bacterium]|jgi:hypothetical protein|nr:hypothetical protein [Candidatus Eremiobacteraeota bacterium]
MFAIGRRSEPGLTVLVVAQAVALFCFGPLFAGVGVPRVAAVAFGIAVAVLTVCIVLAVVWHNRLAVAAVVASTGLELAAIALRLLRPSGLTEILDFVAALLLFTALTVVLATVVFGPGRVTVHRILGAIAIYLNMAFAFALGYRLIAAVAAGAFSARIVPPLDHCLFDFVYFSLTTLTTSGYGDIVPVVPLARSLANLEAVIGQLFPATVLARLVTLELEATRGRRSRRRHSPAARRPSARRPKQPAL